MCLKLNKTTIVPVLLKRTWRTDAKFTVPLNIRAMVRIAQVALPVPQRKGPNRSGDVYVNIPSAYC